MYNKLAKTTYSFLLVFCCFFCKGKPYELPFQNAGGYVIARERCGADTTQEYWLVDLSIFPRPSPYGDSLWLNGSLYRNVVKTTGLAPEFKFIGARVDFDFHLSKTPVTSNCGLTNPLAYRVREMQVLNQAEVK